MCRENGVGTVGEVRLRNGRILKNLKSLSGGGKKFESFENMVTTPSILLVYIINEAALCRLSVVSKEHVDMFGVFSVQKRSI